MANVYTSKILLFITVLVGLFAIGFKLFNTPYVTVAYVSIILVLVFNRVDSRKRGYEFKADLGGNSLSLKAIGDDDENE